MITTERKFALYHTQRMQVRHSQQSLTELNNKQIVFKLELRLEISSSLNYLK